MPATPARNRAIIIALMMTRFVRKDDEDRFVQRKDRDHPLPPWQRITLHW